MAIPKGPTLSTTSTKRVSEHGRPPTPRPTRIVVERAGDGARFAVLDQGHYLAPRPVSGGTVSGASSPNRCHLRVALIGIHMMLLAGDDVRIEVSVGPGVTLEVIEPAGMVAYDAEGLQSRWCLDAELGDGSVLIWEGAPFVAAAGSNVLRETRIRLGTDARVLVRETLVLGRSGEESVPLRSMTRITGADGIDHLFEDLDLSGTRQRAVGILGSSKVLASATAAGWRPEDVPAGTGTGTATGTAMGTAGADARRFDLARPGAVVRALTATAHMADRQIEPEYARWKAGLV